MNPMRKLPQPTAESKPFWQGGASNTLLIRRCKTCQKYHHPPLPNCPHCLSWSVQPESVSGRARVVSFTINHQAWYPGMAVPFVIAYVSIVEQDDIWLMTNIVGCAPEDVAIGQLVGVSFEQREDVWIPQFTPLEET